MPREKETFRENLVAIKERFGDKEILNLSETARFLGKDRRTLIKWIKARGFPAELSGNRYAVKIRPLASWMS